MSRIGKQPIVLPSSVELTYKDADILVKGPKGELRKTFPPSVTLAKEDGVWKVSVRHPEEKKDRSLWGLYKRLLDNMIVGVTVGFSKKLQMVGVGYKANLQGNVLTLNLGFSHPIQFPVPDGIMIALNENEITVSGIDNGLVGDVAARIRSLRKPEPYKGKGIRYADEQIRRKAGKSAKTA